MTLFAAYVLLATSQGSKTPPWVDQTLSGVKVSCQKIFKPGAQQVKDPAMSKVEFWQAQTQECVFVVGVSTIKNPEKTHTSALMSGTAAGFSEGEGTTITGMKDLVLQGWPGIAITVRQSYDVVGAGRIYRCGNQVVQVCGFYPSNFPRPAAIDKFLDSLRLPSDGDLKVAGPVLTRFPLGDSGLTALFPREPDHIEREVGKGTAKGPMHLYSSDYAIRSFQVAYRDIPFTKPPTSDELDTALVMIADEIVSGLQGKKTKSKDETVGEDPALSVDFNAEGGAVGKVLVYMHGNRMIALIVFSPRAYSDPATIDTFLHSVQIKP